MTTGPMRWKMQMDLFNLTFPLESLESLKKQLVLCTKNKNKKPT